MKNDHLKPDDYRWVKVKTGEELLMTGTDLRAKPGGEKPGRIPDGADVPGKGPVNDPRT